MSAFVFDGTSGTTVTNAGQIEATTFLVNSGSSMSLDNAYGKTNTGLKVIAAASVTVTADFNFDSDNNSGQVTVEFTTPVAAPSATLTVFSVRHTAGQAMRMVVGTTGNIVAFDSNSTHSGTIISGASWNTRYRVTFQLVGGSTTVSSIIAKGYLSGSNTQIGSGINASNWNMGANPLRSVRLGDTGPAATYGFDELQMNAGAGSEIPEYVYPAPPALNSPVKRWNGTEYVNVEVYRWSGSAYIPILLAS